MGRKVRDPLVLLPNEQIREQIERKLDGREAGEPPERTEHSREPGFGIGFACANPWSIIQVANEARQTSLTISTEEQVIIVYYLLLGYYSPPFG